MKVGAALVAMVTLWSGELSPPISAMPAQNPPPLDCQNVVRTGNYQALPARFGLLSHGERLQCLSQLLENLKPAPADERGSDPYNAFDTALIIEDLAKEGFIEDAAVIHPIIECLSSNWNYVGMFCNRVMASLTRHSDGLWPESWGTPSDPETHDRIVADWIEYERMLQHGHPIFDTLLADACVSAIHNVRIRLVDTLASSVPGHVVLSYLGSPGPSTIPRKQGRAQVIYAFGLGDIGLGPGFTTPANWVTRRSALRGIRILMFRPGVPNPVSPQRPDHESDIELFPTSDADYREVFSALDLEVRFQIVTSSDDLRRLTIEGVKEGLKGLREANGALVR